MKIRVYSWLVFLFMLLLCFAAGCGQTVKTERITQIVEVTPEVPEVTRLVTVEHTRELTVPVTVLVTRVRRETVIITATPVPPPDRLGEAAAFQAAVRWVVAQQRGSGGFGNARQTAWAVLALRAAGLDPAAVLHNGQGRSPLDYLDNLVEENLIAEGETAALVALALHAAGRELPPALALADPPHPDAWPALPLTLLALPHDTPAAARDALLDALLADTEGGFEGAAQAAWCAMVKAKLALSPAAELAYLRETQEAWESDAFTAALAVQALAAAREDPIEWGAPGRALLQMQREDGSFGGDLVTTAAAVIALRETWLGGLD